MQKIFKILFSTCLLFTTGYSDEEIPAYPSTVSYEDECCLPIKLSGELLYFKPSMEDSSYAISSFSNTVGDTLYPTGKRHHNRPNYKPGFRIEAIYDCDCNQLDGRFTYFRSGHSDSSNGLFQFDTIGYPGSGAQSPEDTSYSGVARIHDRYRYYAGDLTFNRICLSSCADNLYLLLGLHYANIQHKKHFRSFGTFIDVDVTTPFANLLNSSSRFWGIGPEIGIDYTYKLPHCCLGWFTLHTDLRAALLVSKTHTSFHYNSLNTAGTVGVNLKNDFVWRVNPTIDARIGGSYDFCWFGYEGTLEVGYEWLWYHNCINSITGIDVAYPGDTIDYYSNFSLHGPYVRLGVDF